jgi:hypothetical protein
MRFSSLTLLANMTYLKAIMIFKTKGLWRARVDTPFILRKPRLKTTLVYHLKLMEWTKEWQVLRRLRISLHLTSMQINRGTTTLRATREHHHRVHGEEWQMTRISIHSSLQLRIQDWFRRSRNKFSIRPSVASTRISDHRTSDNSSHLLLLTSTVNHRATSMPTPSLPKNNHQPNRARIRQER